MNIQNTHEGEYNLQLATLLLSIIHCLIDFTLLYNGYNELEKKDLIHSFFILINVLFII